ncbi:MAG: nuclear transport factor 2 family protein [Alphaproteobacteria bacterium]|nr:nuclear transport factor 2 family protein [Alphaproteobacteria bacterium]
MSDRESEIRAAIERYAAAWLRSDVAEIVACYHEDFTLHYNGDNALSGDHVGKPAALATLAEFSKRTRRRLVSIPAIMAGADRGALIAREALQDGARTVEIERVLVYAFSDGLLSECWVHDRGQSMIDRIIGQNRTASV